MLPVMHRSTWLPEVFNDFFNTDFMSKANATAPAINIIETEKEYLVELAAPGMKKEDFDIRINQSGDLNIKMESKREKEDKNEKAHYLRREFSYTKFEQTLILPDDVERQNIGAKMTDGVLTISIPKVVKAEVETSRIINVE